MAGRALPDLTSKLLIDTTSLPAAEAQSKAFTETLNTGLGKSTTAAQAFEGQLKSSTGGLGTTTQAAQAFEGQLKSSTTGLGQTNLATQSLGTQLDTTATKSEALSSKLGGLQTATVASGAAGAETQIVLQDLAATQSKATAAATANTDAMAQSAAVVTELAAVDASLGDRKKATTTVVAQEEAALKKSEAAHEAHTEAVKKAIGATGEFGEAGVAATEKMGKLAGILGPAGGISIGLAATVVGLGAAAAVVTSADEAFLKGAEDVLAFQRVTGLSADASSRMVDVFNQLGVSSEVADKAMLQLSKRTEDIGAKTPTAGKTLAELGVQIVKAKDGSTDLEKTLFAVADAYNASSSASQRDAIAMAAFGKAGVALIPVLEQGSEGLKRMSDSAQRVFTQQQLEQVHAYQIEMARSGQEIDKFKNQIGGAVIPVIGGLTESFNINAEAADYAKRKLAEMNLTMASPEYPKLIEQGKKLAQQSRDQAAASNAQAAASKAVDDRLRQEAADQDALLKSDMSLITATEASGRSTKDVANALKTLGDEQVKDSEYADKHAKSLHDIENAQDNLTAAVKAYGPTSDKAVAAQDALNAKVDAGKTLDRQFADQATVMASDQEAVKDAMLRGADAAVTLAEKTAAVNGATLSARDKADIWIQSLQAEEKQLAPGSPLIKVLDDYIAKLNNIPRDIRTQAYLDIQQTPGLTASSGARQHGGSVIPGGVYTVGEAGPETLVMGASGGMVIPHAGDGGGGGSPANVTIHATMMDVDPLAIAQEVAWIMKTTASP